MCKLCKTYIVQYRIQVHLSVTSVKCVPPRREKGLIHRFVWCLIVCIVIKRQTREDECIDTSSHCQKKEMSKKTVFFSFLFILFLSVVWISTIYLRFCLFNSFLSFFAFVCSLLFLSYNEEIESFLWFDSFSSKKELPPLLFCFCPCLSLLLG